MKINPKNWSTADWVMAFSLSVAFLIAVVPAILRIFGYKP